MSESTPKATELVYVPEPSFHPALFAFGLAGIAAGIIVWWPYGVVGAVVALVAFVSMIKAAADQAERLPSRQKPTTAVLPPR